MTGERLAIDIIGWVGTATILGAYLLLSTGRLTGQSRAYQWANVVGAVCFIINCTYLGAFPSVALNVAWAAIGLYTLWTIARRAA